MVRHFNHSNFMLQGKFSCLLAKHHLVHIAQRVSEISDCISLILYYHSYTFGVSSVCQRNETLLTPFMLLIA